MSILVDHQIAQYCLKEDEYNHLKSFKITITNNLKNWKNNELTYILNGVYYLIAYIYTNAEMSLNWEIISRLTNQLNALEVSETLVDFVKSDDLQINVTYLGEVKPMIAPFVNKSVKTTENGTRILSYGLSSAGYDVTLDDDFKIFSNINSRIIDPCNFDEKCLVHGEVLTDDKGLRYVILPPNSYLLGLTKEYFCIPRSIMVVAVGKSTYARAGAIVNVTPIEPGFEGKVVIEISNATGLPMKIYADQGVSQFLFYKASEECTTSYADRTGKYQSQSTLVLPKV